jgi:Lanthionine synthetase C-like protein
MSPASLRYSRLMLWDPREHTAVAGGLWDEDRAGQTVAAIVADAQAAVHDCVWPTHPSDEDLAGSPPTSLYLGSAGMIWGLDQLGCSIDLAGMVERALARYQAEPDFGALAHAASLWMGETGIRLVALSLGTSAGDRDRLRQLIRDNREHETWELMWGSPGTLMAARVAGVTEDAEESARILWDRWDEETDLWTQNLYGQVAQILGPAHGFAGNVQSLRGYVDDEALGARVKRALAATAVHEDGLVNWPPSAAPPVGFDFPIRAQWCHGAPGILATLGDFMDIDLALAAGELIWRAGPLRKGAGLCHGTAGNGYALLKLFGLTADQRWLERARRFAMHAIEQLGRERLATGRGRYTLWTGDVGVALFSRACIRGDPAFPTIDTW